MANEYAIGAGIGLGLPILADLLRPRDTRQYQNTLLSELESTGYLGRPLPTSVNPRRSLIGEALEGIGLLSDTRPLSAREQAAFEQGRLAREDIQYQRQQRELDPIFKKLNLAKQVGTLAADLSLDPKALSQLNTLANKYLPDLGVDVYDINKAAKAEAKQKDAENLLDLLIKKEKLNKLRSSQAATVKDLLDNLSTPEVKRLTNRYTQNQTALLRIRYGFSTGKQETIDQIQKENKKLARQIESLLTKAMRDSGQFTPEMMEYFKSQLVPDYLAKIQEQQLGPILTENYQPEVDPFVQESPTGLNLGEAAKAANEASRFTLPRGQAILESLRQPAEPNRDVNFIPGYYDLSPQEREKALADFLDNPTPQ